MTLLAKTLTAPKILAPPRRFRRRLVGAIAVVFILILAVDISIGFVVQRRVMASAKAKFGLDLHSLFAWYIPPYGISMRHVRLTQPQAGGVPIELFTASGLKLALLALPKEGQTPRLKQFTVTGGQLIYRAAGHDPLEFDHVQVGVAPNQAKGICIASRLTPMVMARNCCAARGLLTPRAAFSRSWIFI